MKIAVIDDERVFREIIISELYKEYPKEDIDSFSSTKAFLDSTTYYDLVLLDIEMPDMNGMQFAKNHKIYIPNLLYVTSYTDYMSEAFDKNVLGFIVKDKIEIDLLTKVKAVEKIITQVDDLTLRIYNQEKRIPRKDILYFYFESGFIYIKTTTDKYILNYTSLVQLREVLNDYFMLVNRNYIVNIENIDCIDKSNKTIEFVDHFPIKVSERKWDEFRKLYKKVVKII